MSRPHRLRDTAYGAIAVLLALLLAPVHTTHAAPAKAARQTTARRTSAVAPQARVLVRIGGEAITVGDVQKRLDELPEQAKLQFNSPEGRQQLLDRMIEERVWLITARKNGVEARPQVQQQLAAQKRDLVIRTYLGEVMATSPAPSDSEAAAYYQEHLSDYKIPASVTLRHIQTGTEKEARNVLKLARAGQDWDKLAQRWSADTLTRSRGGAQPAVTHEGLFSSLGRQPALAESAFALGQGRIGGPWRTDKGWHIVKVDEVKPESARPLDSVRRSINQQLAGQRSQAFYKERLDAERRRLGITADSTAIKNFVSQKKTAREMFKAAQELGPAADRLAAYRQLLDTYPDSEVSAQAQFMMGFIYSEELKNFDEAEKAFRVVLSRYPKSELAASAQWMVDHMRTEEAPAFVPMEADSSAPATAAPRAGRNSTGKP
jgi:peptidyl-prolyl cis-trans isomerase C